MYTGRKWREASIHKLFQSSQNRSKVDKIWPVSEMESLNFGLERMSWQKGRVTHALKSKVKGGRDREEDDELAEGQSNSCPKQQGQGWVGGDRMMRWEWSGDELAEDW